MDLIDSFKSLPIFTRWWLGLTTVITAAITLDVIPSHQVFLDWDRIIGNHGRVELWRILTSFCYCGAPLNELYSLFLLFTIYTHSYGYERDPVRHSNRNVVLSSTRYLSPHLLTKFIFIESSQQGVVADLLTLYSASFFVWFVSCARILFQDTSSVTPTHYIRSWLATLWVRFCIFGRSEIHVLWSN